MAFILFIRLNPLRPFHSTKDRARLTMKPRELVQAGVTAFNWDKLSFLRSQGHPVPSTFEEPNP